MSDENEANPEGEASGSGAAPRPVVVRREAKSSGYGSDGGFSEKAAVRSNLVRAYVFGLGINGASIAVAMLIYGAIDRYLGWVGGLMTWPVFSLGGHLVFFLIETLRPSASRREGRRAGYVISFLGALCIYGCCWAVLANA
jgi:ATP/ADP translocase